MKPLTVEKLSKNFGGLQALSDVSFSVESGERLAIIGPNGAGKTTLFHVITGVLRPSGGKVFLFGKDVTNMPVHQRSRLGLARTFQVTNLFFDLTVQENVLLAIQALDSTRLGLLRPINYYRHLFIKCQRLLEQWELCEERDTPVRNLSHGKQRKLEIVLAQAQDPSLLLFDEPTAGLTSAEVDTLVSMIQTLPRESTVIIIEHNIDVVSALADHVLVLHFGEVLANGSLEEVKKNASVQRIYIGGNNSGAVRS